MEATFAHPQTKNRSTCVIFENKYVFKPRVWNPLLCEGHSKPDSRTTGCSALWNGFSEYELRELSVRDPKDGGAVVTHDERDAGQYGR